MRATLIIAFGIAFLAAAGCGGSGGSGVDRDKNVNELNEDETWAFCEWSVEEQGGPGTVQCDENHEYTVPTVEECVESDNKPACSVGIAEDCIASLEGDPCQLFESDACADYIRCAFETNN